MIVGAGPEGLNCAERLIGSGKNVLVLEKNEVIGPKVCAGGLSLRGLGYLELPKDLLDNSFDEEFIDTPLQRTRIGFKDPFIFTIDREKLGQWQLKKLEGSEVEVRKGSLVTDIRNDRVIIDRTKGIGFKHLVGADGASSKVRMHLGIPRENYGIAIQYIIPRGELTDFNFFIEPKLFHSWYAWTFPRREYVSIGCGCDPRLISIKTLKENFAKWLKINKIDVSFGRFEASPLNYDFRGIQFGNVYLVGDAAGLTSPVTGEGIHQALISGEEAARLIMGCGSSSEEMRKVIRKWRQHNRIITFLKWAGPLRGTVFEVFAFTLKSKFIARRGLDILL